MKAIVDMYAAVKAGDAARFHAVVAPDFYLFERGKRMDADTIFHAIADAQAKGRRFEWNVTDPTVRIDCNMAVITYTNVGSIGEGSATQPMSWLESAELGYEAGAWRIHFSHSTRVPQE